MANFTFRNSIGLLCTAFSALSRLRFRGALPPSRPSDDAVAATVGNETIRVGDVQRALTRSNRRQADRPGGAGDAPGANARRGDRPAAGPGLRPANRPDRPDADQKESAAAGATFWPGSPISIARWKSISRASRSARTTCAASWPGALFGRSAWPSSSRRRGARRIFRRIAASSTAASLPSATSSCAAEGGTGLSPVYGRSTGETPVPPRRRWSSRPSGSATILSGKISFAEAAAKYSAGPSGKQGGRLGQIARHGPMSETFSRAAFALEVGQISPPTPTPFGVDLIRCDGIKPGGKRSAERRQGSGRGDGPGAIGKACRGRAAIHAGGVSRVWPHFKPGTRELATE